MPNKTLRGEDSSEVIELYDSLEESLTITREEFLAAVKKAAEEVDAAGLIAIMEHKEKTFKESTLAMEWFLDEYNIDRSK